MLVAHGILVSDPVPIGFWILTALGLAWGLGLGILDLGLVDILLLDHVELPYVLDFAV